MKEDDRSYNLRTDFHITDTDTQIASSREAQIHSRRTTKAGFDETLKPYDYIAGELLDEEPVLRNELIKCLGENPRKANRRLDQILDKITQQFPSKIIEGEMDFEDEKGQIFTDIGIQLILQEE